MALASMSEIQQLLGVGKTTLYRWRKQGAPFKKRGREWLGSVDEVREWAAAKGYLDGRKTPRKAPEEISDEDRDALRAIGIEDPDQILGLSEKLVSHMLRAGKARKELAEAERRELDLQMRKGELVDAADVKAGRLSRISRVKAAFAAFPGRVAPRLVRRDYDDVYETLERELNAVLEEFAKG